MQMQHETHKLCIRLQRWQEGSQYIKQSIALGCVTLVDATGHHHQISVNLCASYQQFNDMLQVLFKRDVIQAQIQRRYDLRIDKGTEVTPLTSHEWSSIEPGTKIVMRVTIQQETDSGSDINYRCHFCSAVDCLGVKSVKYEYDTQTQIVCATDCRECKRRFQITRCLQSAFTQKRRTRFSSSDSGHKTDTETPLIRDFHVQQIRVHDLVFVASWATLMVPWPCPALSLCVISSLLFLGRRVWCHGHVPLSGTNA
ncbi:hypothetical protein BDR07DRAFT_170666 [Suillus spraguei]|nr:hypothetical protein BDR07DRAFT_170666 [Suillus spraguei]